ncbi:MAG: hypothetical protein NC342_07265 [Pseudoflavonifractor sp.]|nr:hypothetical protein [Alloprevotella sp.]MCM1117318.1 hypothetical protein [Pseudoflavonifractor sp.]
MNNLFSLSLRKYIGDNRRHLILNLAGIAAAWFFFGFFMALSGSGGGDGQIVVLIIASGIAATVFAANSFSSMKATPGRISTLMLPAAPIHKFMARWCVAVPMALVVLLLAFWEAELVRLALWPIFNESAPSLITVYLSTTNNPLIIFIAPMALAQATFFLGAIVWPRLSFVKTMVATWVLGMLFSIALAIGIQHMSDNIGHTDNIGYTHLNEDLFLTLYSVGCIAISAWLYFLAYIRFRESDIVDPLF